MTPFRPISSSFARVLERAANDNDEVYDHSTVAAKTLPDSQRARIERMGARK